MDPSEAPTAPRASRSAETDSPDRALADLIAAGLVSHEMICDPALLGAEAPALERLCARVAGAIYRIGPFHYAFRAAPGDLDGALGALPRDDWAGALAADLRAGLGAEAVWITATDLLADALALAGPAGTVPGDAALLLVRREAAVAAGLEAAPAGARAVIDAVYATETARLTAARARAIAADLAREMAAEMAAGIAAEIRAEIRAEALAEARGIARALVGTPEGPDAVAAALEAIAARLGALERAAEGGGADPGLGRIEAALEALAARLDAGESRGDLLGEHLAEHLTLRLGSALGAGAPARPEGDFEERLGLALAEFLARIERAAEAGPGAVWPH